MKNTYQKNDIPTVQDIQKGVLSVVSKFPIKKIGLFGSYARGQAREDSDIDLLAEMEKPVSLLKSIHIESIFSDALKKRVELVTTGGLYKPMQSFIMKDYIPLYEK